MGWDWFCFDISLPELTSVVESFFFSLSCSCLHFSKFLWWITILLFSLQLRILKLSLKDHLRMMAYSTRDKKTNSMHASNQTWSIKNYNNYRIQLCPFNSISNVKLSPHWISTAKICSSSLLFCCGKYSTVWTESQIRVLFFRAN